MASDRVETDERKRRTAVAVVTEVGKGSNLIAALCGGGGNEGGVEGRKEQNNEGKNLYRGSNLFSLGR